MRLHTSLVVCVACGKVYSWTLLLGNPRLLRTVFLLDFISAIYYSGRKVLILRVGFQTTFSSHLNNMMTSPSGSQADPVAEISLSSRAKVSAIARECYAQAAKEGGNNNRLWVTADSTFSSTSLRFTVSGHPIEPFEWDMHDLWYLYLHAALREHAKRWLLAASGMMDSHLHAVSGVSSCASSETKMSPKQRVEPADRRRNASQHQH
jgi:hypothetical protein